MWWPVQERWVLRTDLGESLLLATAKADDGGVVYVVPFLKASSRSSSRPLSATSGGNPRSVDRMTATLWCRFPFGGVIHGGTHNLRWSGIPCDTSTSWSLGGEAQQSLGDGCVMMSARREEALSGAVGASTAGLARSMRQ
ncbi:hypothetical protein D1007_08170 [Hordeum vulgare]|nr:hypothetical protein D1007_08170 [Hordeum vulgare]